jgi:hypothetical protein
MGSKLAPNTPLPVAVARPCPLGDVAGRSLEQDVADAEFFRAFVGRAVAKGIQVAIASFGQYEVIQARRVIRSEHSTDVESPPPPPRVCMTFQPEGRPRSEPDSSRFSLTLLQGVHGPCGGAVQV